MSNEKLKPESTLTDGNCAFNAFALGLADQSKLDGIRSQSQDIDIEQAIFIAEAAAALNLPEPATWAALTKALLALHSKPETTPQLQKALAPILRNIAISAAKADHGNRDEMADTIISAAYHIMIDCYHNKKITEPTQISQALKDANDDVITKHSRIFLKLFGSIKDGKSVEDVKQWWNNRGYEMFLDCMQQSSEWAGDLELAYLARHFRVNIAVYNEVNKRTSSLIEILPNAPTITLHKTKDHWSNTLPPVYQAPTSVANVITPVTLTTEEDYNQYLVTSIEHLKQTCEAHINHLLALLAPKENLSDDILGERYNEIYPQYHVLEHLINILENGPGQNIDKIIQFHTVFSETQHDLTRETAASIENITAIILKSIFTFGIYALVRGVQCYQETNSWLFWKKNVAAHSFANKIEQCVNTTGLY